MTGPRRGRRVFRSLRTSATVKRMVLVVPSGFLIGVRAAAVARNAWASMARVTCRVRAGDATAGQDPPLAGGPVAVEDTDRRPTGGGPVDTLRGPFRFDLDSAGRIALGDTLLAQFPTEAAYHSGAFKRAATRYGLSVARAREYVALARWFSRLCGWRRPQARNRAPVPIRNRL